MGQALILAPMVIFLVTGESFTGQSFGSSSICSIICFLKRQLGVRRWVPSPCATQFLLQLINFTLHVPFILCMGNIALPLRLTFTGIRCVHTPLVISPLLKVTKELLCWEPPDSAWCKLASFWCGPIVGWCGPDSSIFNAISKSPLEQIKFFPQTAPIVTTNLGLDQK